VGRSAAGTRSDGPFAAPGLRYDVVELFNNAGVRRRRSVLEAGMATMNFSVPDEVKEAFNAAFAGRNKSAVIAELMREAVEREVRRARSVAAIDRILARAERAPVRSGAKLAAARTRGRS
jgi:hypothetical protein